MTRRCARRRSRDFAHFQTTHERAVEAHEGPLTQKLIAARKRFVASILAKFPAAFKAGSDQPTHGEMEALIAAIEAANAEDYIDALHDAQDLLMEVGWTNAKALLGIKTGFDVIPQHALEQLLSDSDALILKVTGREKDALKQVVYDAMQDGKTVDETASAIREALDAGYHLDANRTMDVDAWSRMVARTELSAAANDGAFALYREAGVEKVTWLAQAGCDICEEADGVTVDIGDDFPGVDTDEPPAHANCRCCTVPADEWSGDFSGTDEEITNAQRGGYTADEYEAKFGFRNPIDD